MPQPTQQCLIQVLLLWITVLSIVQVVFVIRFFTAEHHCLSQNCSAVAPERPMQFRANNTPSSRSEHGFISGEMLTLKATEVNGKVKWQPRNSDQGLVSEEEGNVLKIKKDGYFFLHLQVTLTSCNATYHPQSVSLKRNNKVILQAGINTNTCSTGFLGKVEELSAGHTLLVTLPTTDGDIDESLTHLDIIYMPKKH